MTFQLYHGDCLDVMAGMDANSVDAIVCDPPYGLDFMGKDWDHGVPGVHFWQEALRVAKPGAHLLAFGGTRTFHRLACAIEDAGWELRDTLSWLYGSGFPKSHDVSKAIDKAAGAERENGGVSSTACPDFPNPCQGHPSANGSLGGGVMRHSLPTAPATPEAEQWAGYGTALKPAWEPIIMARKPFRGTVAANVLEWGTGAINVDATRVPTDNGEPAYTDRPQGVSSPDWVARGGKFKEDRKGRTSTGSPAGRWPPNLVHDGSDEVTRCFPVTGNNWRSDKTSTNGHSVFGVGQPLNVNGHNDTGSASRFFPALPLDAEDVDAARVMYCAKASKRDRDDGCEGLEARVIDERNGYSTLPDLRMDHKQARSTSRNHHPTVKPTALMRWLVRLVTPPGGVVLDPFMGSGSTGKAAIIEGFDFIGIELEAEYIEIARRRIEAAQLPLLATG